MKDAPFRKMMFFLGGGYTLLRQLTQLHEFAFDSLCPDPSCGFVSLKKNRLAVQIRNSDPPIFWMDLVYHRVFVRKKSTQKRFTIPWVPQIAGGSSAPRLGLHPPSVFPETPACSFKCPKFLMVTWHCTSPGMDLDSQSRSCGKFPPHERQ